MVIWEIPIKLSRVYDKYVAFYVQAWSSLISIVYNYLFALFSHSIDCTGWYAGKKWDTITGTLKYCRDELWETKVVVSISLLSAFLMLMEAI